MQMARMPGEATRCPVALSASGSCLVRSYERRITHSWRVHGSKESCKKCKPISTSTTSIISYSIRRHCKSTSRNRRLNPMQSRIQDTRGMQEELEFNWQLHYHHYSVFHIGGETGTCFICIRNCYQSSPCGVSAASTSTANAAASLSASRAW